MVSPTLTLISGPNGAGKTTFARENFFKEIEEGLFLNADLIAASLKGDNPDQIAFQAGRTAIQLREKLLYSKKSFIIESTLATRSLLNFIKKAKREGYKLTLYYLWISDPKLCDFRVKERVNKGGHNIPLDVILRRYDLGLKYFNSYLTVADKAYIYLSDSLPQEISFKENGKLEVLHSELWTLFTRTLSSYTNSQK